MNNIRLFIYKLEFCMENISLSHIVSSRFLCLETRVNFQIHLPWYTQLDYLQVHHLN